MVRKETDVFHTKCESFSLPPFSRRPPTGGSWPNGALENTPFSGKVSRFLFGSEKPLSRGLKNFNPAQGNTPTEKQTGGDYGVTPPGPEAGRIPFHTAHPGSPVRRLSGAIPGAPAAPPGDLTGSAPRPPQSQQASARRRPTAARPQPGPVRGPPPHRPSSRAARPRPSRSGSA